MLTKTTLSQQDTKMRIIFALLSVTTLLLLLMPNFHNAWHQLQVPGDSYLLRANSHILTLISLLVLLVLGQLYFYLEQQYEKQILFLSHFFVVCFAFVIGNSLSDQCWLMVHLLARSELSTKIAEVEWRYFTQEFYFYAALIGLGLSALSLLFYIYRYQLHHVAKLIKRHYVALFMVFPASWVIGFYAFYFLAQVKFRFPLTEQLPLTLSLSINVFFLLMLAFFMLGTIPLKKPLKLSQKWLMDKTQQSILIASIIILLNIVNLLCVLVVSIHTLHTLAITALSKIYFTTLLSLIPCLLGIGFCRVLKITFKKLQFADEDPTSNTRGVFGTAELANKTYLQAQGFYASEKRSIIGRDDDNQHLFFPLSNATIISAPGGGKTAYLLSILLTEDRPFFGPDIKGELFAVAARFRATGFKRYRRIVAIDPFGILQQSEFCENKPKEILIFRGINPFDYISEDPLKQDRDINVLVQALVSHRDNGYDEHWTENAEILISGLIDYILKTHEPHERNLICLLAYLSQDKKETEALLQIMLRKGGQAQMAAAQVLKTADEERGSIFSTTYRQIKWLMDINMQNTFRKSTFDLNEFLHGDMDIFIVLPEDQVVYHKRVFRLLFSLVTNLIAKTSPSQLPKEKVLFLLDELGQLGYCPDVERAIEILRGRGAIVWSVFQSLGQIKLYKKPDLFFNAKIKLIFDVDDEATMKWVQTLGGEHDVITRSFSTNKSVAQQTSKTLDTNTSQSDSISLQETKAHLIPLNEIRELPNDAQFVFIRGYKTIKCKRAFYFNHPFFEERFDKNPYIIEDEA